MSSSDAHAHDHDARAARLRSEAEDDAVVTPVELFFDLVFVFALTQVTSLLEADPHWVGLVRGLAVLAVLWWAWTGYVWLTNSIRPDDGAARLVLLVANAPLPLRPARGARARGRRRLAARDVSGA